MHRLAPERRGVLPLPDAEVPARDKTRDKTREATCHNRGASIVRERVHVCRSKREREEESEGAAVHMVHATERGRWGACVYVRGREGERQRQNKREPETGMAGACVSVQEEG